MVCTFDDVMAFSDEQIEHTHNFIQWLFPLPAPSLSVPGSPCLSDADVSAIKNSRFKMFRTIDTSAFSSPFRGHELCTCLHS